MKWGHEWNRELTENLKYQGPSERDFSLRSITIFESWRMSLHFTYLYACHYNFEILRTILFYTYLTLCKFHNFRINQNVPHIPLSLLFFPFTYTRNPLVISFLTPIFSLSIHYRRCTVVPVQSLAGRVSGARLPRRPLRRPRPWAWWRRSRCDRRDPSKVWS